VEQKFAEKIKKKYTIVNISLCNQLKGISLEILIAPEKRLKIEIINIMH
jgi:hypothetical protein